jgi:hypothetical protein
MSQFVAGDRNCSVKVLRELDKVFQQRFFQIGKIAGDHKILGAFFPEHG